MAAAGGYVFDVELGRLAWRICTCTRTGEESTDSAPPAEAYLGMGADPFLYLSGCSEFTGRGVNSHIPKTINRELRTMNWELSRRRCQVNDVNNFCIGPADQILANRGTDKSSAPCDKNAHEKDAFAKSRKYGRRLSFSERMAEHASTGQLMPISGSFQITPASWLAL